MVCDCCTVLDAVKEAIEPCAKLLGYKPSALQCDIPLCGLPEHSQDKLHQFHLKTNKLSVKESLT